MNLNSVSVSLEGSRLKIMIADDHELVRDTLAAFLEKEKDIEVTSVEDLPAAITEIKSGKRFDLVLLDYSMPGMNGLEGLEKAIEESIGRPIAVMSGTAPKAIAQEALD